MNVFDLFASLSLNSDGYNDALDESESKTNEFGDALKGGLVTATGIAVTAITAVTTAVTAVSTALFKGVGQVAEYGDTIDKVSQQLGLSYSAYQEWDFILQHTGTDISTLRTAMRTLSNAVESGNEAFEQLGITQEQLATMSLEELFSATITGLQNIDDETTRTAIASDLLGRSYQELNPLLNMTAEETSAMIDTLYELGGVMSDEAVKDSATFQDSLLDMKTSLNGLRNNMLSKFMPSMSKVMNGLSKIFSGADIEGGLEDIRTGVSEFSESLKEQVPVFLEIGGEILNALAQAITENMPLIIETGSLLINSILDGISPYLPELALGALQIISRIGQELITALPELVPVISDLISFFAENFANSETMGDVVQAGLDLLQAVMDGVREYLPEISSVVVDIISEFILAYGENFPLVQEATLKLMVTLGLALIESVKAFMVKIKSNVSQKWDDIKSTISTKITNIKTTVGTKLSDVLSKVQEKLNSIKEKFTSVFDDVKSTVSNAIQKVKDTFDFEWSLPSLKLPHVTISGSFSIDPPSVPSFSVSWYKKAYDNAYLLNDATIFGAYNGKLLGGGEGNGAEAIVGTEFLKNMVTEAMSNIMKQMNLNVYLDGNTLVGAIAPRMDNELGRLANLSAKGVY